MQALTDQLASVDQAPRYAPWTVPAQPAPRRGFAAARLGAAALVAGFATLAAVAIYRVVERGERGATPEAASRAIDDASDEHGSVTAARRLSAGAAVLALSVMADSGVEHYRGGFHNPAMFIAPVTAGVSLAHSIHMALTPHYRGRGRTVLSALVLVTGAAGIGFHVYNVGKREGGFALGNLFYAAPLGAPIAIMLSGLAGAAASQLAIEARDNVAPTLLDRPAGGLIAAGAAVAMLGTVGEAALLHFRGAFHDPFMYIPVTVPPTAAGLLVAAIKWRQTRSSARWLLYATAAAGLAGCFFHALGVARNMGGFRNWSQNILNGPPIPAPPSFTGVALAGLAAIGLLEEK